MAPGAVILPKVGAGSGGWDALLAALDGHRRTGRRIVTTTGCFDILHSGHVRFLTRARELGDVLVVGLNGDSSVRTLKGADRPLNKAADRAMVLSSIRWVDHVVVFDDLLPIRFLDAVRPSIYCKSAEYEANALPEAEVVRRHGGEVRILPHEDAVSTSLLAMPAAACVDAEESETRRVLTGMLEASNLLRQTGYQLCERVVAEAARMAEVLTSGARIFTCGNGGSAADAQHFAAEIVGRFRLPRDGGSVVALTTDTSIITGIANDFGYAEVFRLQLRALARPGDLLFAISTSGRSPSILRAAEEARRLALWTTALTGAHGSPLQSVVDATLAVPSMDTALVQQGQRAVLHALSDILDRHLAKGRT